MVKGAAEITGDLGRVVPEDFGALDLGVAALAAFLASSPGWTEAALVLIPGAAVDALS